jgi:uncharacterized membrane protein
LSFVGLLPWIRGLVDPELPTSVTRAIDLAFSGLCHHAPERTLLLRGAAMCVCSRCAGVYLGILIAALWPWRASTTRMRTVLTAGLALMIADILSQDLGVHAPWHAVRLATGAIVGLAATTWMLSEIESSGRGRRDVDHGEALPS